MEKEIGNYQKQLSQYIGTKRSLENQIDNLNYDDKHYDRKLSDLQDRLDKMYDNIEDVEHSLKDCKDRKRAIEAEKLTGDNIYKTLIYFDKLYNVMEDADKRALLTALIKEIHVYEEEQANGQWLKSMIFKLPIIESNMEICLDNETHVDTVVPVSGVELDQAELAFDVTRTLEGDRRNPSESYSVTPSKRLYETVSPEYADNKEVTWAAGDTDMLRVDQEGMVSANADARWIADLIRTEEETNRENPYNQREAGGSRSSYVTVTTKDGDKQAVCAVNASFRTVDSTVVHVENVSLNRVK